jgi:hypothetical protein
MRALNLGPFDHSRNYCWVVHMTAAIFPIIPMYKFKAITTGTSPLAMLMLIHPPKRD